MGAFERQPPSRRRQALLLVGAAIAGLCIGAIVASLFFGGGDDEGAAAGSQRFATVGELVANPERWFGRQVGVSSEVAEVLGPRSLLIGGRELEGGDSLLVVGRQPFAVAGGRRLQRAIVETDLVSLAGRLQVFDERRLERRLEVGLPDRLGRFDGDPVLVLDEILITPRLLQPVGRVTPAQIVSQPRAYLGDLVAVRGRVTDLVRDEGLVLDGRLLVLAGAVRADSVKQGDVVTVRGGVRPLDPAQVPDRGSLDEQLFGELTSAPAVTAGAINIESR